MKIKLLFTTLLVTFLAYSHPNELGKTNSENKGIISGTITDKDTNETLPFVNVVVKETKTIATSDIEGKFNFKLNPGKYTLEFSYVGYDNAEYQVNVVAGQTITVNQALEMGGGVKLEGVIVQAAAPRGKETALLLEQKNAVEIKQSIGKQELDRKGVSDASAAVVKTSGIAKQEDSGNIFVRGLGDRYNSTTINGLPVPSNDPEKKNINLELFSTDIVEYISVDKVYNGKFFGDFAGGNVDIVSKDYNGDAFLRLQIGSKVNSNALAEEDFKLRTGIGGLGFAKFSIPNNPLTQYNYNSLQLKSYTPIANAVKLSGGKSFKVGSEGKLNFFATASFDNDFSSRSNGSAKSNVNGQGIINKDFKKYSFLKYETNTTLMANIGYNINNNNKINFNSLFVNTSNQSKEEYFGFIVDIANDGNGTIRRFNYEKNTLWINQILGSHRVGIQSHINWGVSYNTINGDMPDRVQNIYRKEDNGYVLSSISAPDNHRYYQKLKEDEAAANAAYDVKFNQTESGEYKGKLTVGYNGRFKNRAFEASQFNFKNLAPYNGTIVDPNNLDLYYNQENLANGYFEISTFRGGSQVPNALRPQLYNGEQIINGGFVNTEYKFNKLIAVVGLRGENISQKVDWDTQLGARGKNNLDKTAFLPSLIMKYEINDKQNLRLGASKTYTLPQFKERALFVYEDVLQVKVGNPDLYASDDYNFDLKWEMFPKSEELISITGFGKYIKNPMNEVTINSSTNDISFLNTGDFGYVTGAELEYRKLLFDFKSENTKKLSAGLNASYLHSYQELDSEKVKRETNYEADFTHTSGKFTGASDLLLNTDLSFFNEWNNSQNNLTTTVTYSYFSDKVYSIGTLQRGNLVDKAFGTLDFIVKSKFNNKIGIDFIAKNLLNPTINRVQENATGDINVLSYKKGLTFSLNVNYQF